MRVLISGFEPFGGRDTNPTALLIEALKNSEISLPPRMTVNQILLPVTFENSFHILNQKIQSFNPDIIISFGQAAKRDSVELETKALNRIDAEICDNAGVKPQDQIINPNGEEFYLSTLPIQGIETALKNASVPVKISNSAGTYVCNYLFYRLMETNQDTLRLCGFIHVPLLPEQAKGDEPTLAFHELKRALTVILNYINY